ncbi:Serine/threonine-protein kinase PknK [Clostridium paraputrificum]|uniref:Serine/threonine-protein kinase PknK n=1 Tax=Clostridium paraputrificum TaxID=29363 RepID=A0A6N2Y6P7_9CLOT
MTKKPDVSGGNGNIFFDLENQTATKYLRNTSSKERIERFKQEQRVLKELSKKPVPNIVEILEVNIDENKITNSFIKMKKYDGSLSDLFSATRGNAKLTLQLILPIIKALKTLSENAPHIYHRDLKPDNILYLKKDNSYELYLTDFGTCFLKNEVERITPENIAVGARMFLAPEYEMGRVESVTEKGDIYSIGKIIWCMINGEENVILPSNFWFVDEFDLSKKFPSNIDIISTNLVIASCLNLNPEERCNYDELITLINNILHVNHSESIIEKQYKVRQYQEKRKIELIEIMKKNKLLVNNFSIIYIKALEQLNSIYPNFEFLEKLYKDYCAKSKDGTDYTTRNVDDNSAHYLYSTSFDNIYLSINYNPASGDEKYASISVYYIINSSGKNEQIKIKYNENGILISEYNGITQIFNEKEILNYFDNLIMNYIE